MITLAAWKAIVLAIAYFGGILALIEDYSTDGERRQNG